MSATHGTHAHASRINALRMKHADLDRKISVLSALPATSAMELRSMKRERLFLKEEIEGIR